MPRDAPVPFDLPEREYDAPTLGDRAVHALLTDDIPGLLGFVRDRLRAIAGGQVRVEAPPKQVFEAPDGGDFRVMPCVTTRGSERFATVKIVGTNRAQRIVPGQITVGSVCVLHPREHFITHRFDACVFSSARTGLLAALGTQLLADRRDAVLVIGAGRVGYYSARYLAEVPGVRAIAIADADPARARLCAQALTGAGLAVDVSACPKVPDEAPVAVLATTAHAPLWCLDDAAAPVLAVSVGADARGQHELCPAWHRAELYTDGPDSLLTGDLAAWAQAGLEFATPRVLTDAVAAPPGPARRARALISTGTALWDNLVCAYLVRRLGGGAG